MVNRIHCGAFSALRLGQRRPTSWSVVHEKNRFTKGIEDILENEFFSVAIDGPSGAGKSTLAKCIASRFGFIYVDTGAIYRTVGLATFRAGVDPHDEKGVEALLPTIEIELCHDSAGGQRMLLGGEDVSDAIRMPEISIYASDVSAMPAVRAFLLDMQRDLALRHNVIMDGRDIGTVVLPDAQLKIFLTAGAQERAKRRLKELEEKGVETTFEQVLADIEYRDSNDSSRSAAPLKPAEDSVAINNSGSIEDSIARISALISERYGK